MAFSATIARLWSPGKGATTGRKVNLDSPCSVMSLDEKDSEHLEHTPTFLLEDWLREQRQAGGDEFHGEWSESEEHFGATMPLEAWLSTQEGDGGTGGPTQQSVGGVRLEDKQDSAVAIDAPGEISIESGVNLSCSSIKGTLNSRGDDGDEGSGRGSGKGCDGDGGSGSKGGGSGGGDEEYGGEGKGGGGCGSGSRCEDDDDEDDEDDDADWGDICWREDGDEDNPEPKFSVVSPISFFVSPHGVAHRSLEDERAGANREDASGKEGTGSKARVLQLEEDLAKAREEIKRLAALRDATVFESDEYRELWGAWRYEGARVDWLREVLRWRVPVPKLPAQWRDNWQCRLCGIDNGSRETACATCRLPKGAFEGGDSSVWIRFNPEDWIPGCVLPKWSDEEPAARSERGEDARAAASEASGGGAGGWGGSGNAAQGPLDEEGDNWGWAFDEGGKGGDDCGSDDADAPFDLGFGDY